MANKNYSLAHTKWMYKYHIIFTPKYRRKIIYNQYRKDLQESIRTSNYPGGFSPKKVLNSYLDIHFHGNLIILKNLLKSHFIHTIVDY